MLQVHLPSHEAHTLIPVHALQRALERQNVRTTISPLRSRLCRALAKLAGSLGIRRMPNCRLWRLGCTLWTADCGLKEPIFFHLNHPWLNALYPYCLAHPCVTYSFDCWPVHYDNWASFFAKNHIHTAFISARQSAREMARRCPATHFHWLPEAVDPTDYTSDLSLANRPIDVLELGRRFEPYHQRITPGLQKNRLVHIYPTQNRGLVFDNNRDVQATFGHSKICICFPQNLTHPDRAGHVETVTLRYFEAIAARCLVLGHCPKELEDLFGYNPVIEANLDNPLNQLLDTLLPRLAQYQPYVDRNHIRLLKAGTVDHRASEIVSALRRVENGPE